VGPGAPPAHLSAQAIALAVDEADRESAARRIATFLSERGFSPH
jgi:hypothetical protein